MMKKNKMKMRKIFLLSTMSLAFTACMNEEETEFEKQQKEEDKILTDYFHGK